MGDYAFLIVLLVIGLIGLTIFTNILPRPVDDVAHQILNGFQDLFVNLVNAVMGLVREIYNAVKPVFV